MILDETTSSHEGVNYDFMFNGSIYKVMTSHTKTIKDARTACSHVMDDGANLAVIDSKEELAVISGEVGYHNISYKSSSHCETFLYLFN